MTNSRTSPRPLDSFEAELLHELRTQVTGRRTVRSPARKRKLIAAAVLGVTGGVSVLGLNGGSPAYAVDQRPDGDIVITLNRLDDAAGLEHKLADLGVHAKVDYEPTPSAGSSSPHVLGEYHPAPGSSLPEDRCDFKPGVGPTAEVTDEHAVITIPAGSVRLDRPLTIITTSGRSLAGISVFWDGCGISSVSVGVGG